VKRVAFYALAIGASVWAGIALLQRGSRDPETSNPPDLNYDAQTLFAPGFFASDPSLTVPTNNRIQERISDRATGKGLADAPYFIEIDDGRFVFGYADVNGFSRPIYTSHEQGHRVYWYDDAWVQWNERKGSIPSPAPTAGDAPTRK
jgi:hypothetical protein